jgi:hypothetical protein
MNFAMTSSLLDAFLPTDLVDIIMSSTGNLDQFVDEIFSRYDNVEVLSYRNNNVLVNPVKLGTSLYFVPPNEKKANKIVVLSFTLDSSIHLILKAFGDDTFRVEVELKVEGYSIISNRIRVFNDIKMIRSIVTSSKEQDIELDKFSSFGESIGLAIKAKFDYLGFRFALKHIPEIVKLTNELFELVSKSLATECYRC